MNTLRTHTKSIYTKLGATSRREALRRAGEYASELARSTITSSDHIMM